MLASEGIEPFVRDPVDVGIGVDEVDVGRRRRALSMKTAQRAGILVRNDLRGKARAVSGSGTAASVVCAHPAFPA
jgi:hypothetical protein